MSDKSLRARGSGYQVINIPLGNAQTKARYAIDCRYLAVVTCPISVEISLNNPDSDLIPLPTVRAIRQEIKYIYVTHSGVSSTNLKLLAFDEEIAEAVGFGVSVTLSSPEATEYDARLLKETESYNNTDNVNNGNTKDSGTLTTSGYNKITGYIESNRDITIECHVSRDDGSSFVKVDSVTHTGSATVATGFEFPVIAAHMKIVFDNSSGGNTTTCDTVVNMSTGA